MRGVLSFVSCIQISTMFKIVFLAIVQTDGFEFIGKKRPKNKGTRDEWMMNSAWEALRCPQMMLDYTLRWLLFSHSIY